MWAWSVDRSGSGGDVWAWPGPHRGLQGVCAAQSPHSPSRPDGHHRPVYARGAPHVLEPARPLLRRRHHPWLPARWDPEHRLRVSGRGRDRLEGGTARAVGVLVRMAESVPRRRRAQGLRPIPATSPGFGSLICMLSRLRRREVDLPGPTRREGPDGPERRASSRARHGPALQSHGRWLGQAARPRVVPDWGDLPGKLRPDEIRKLNFLKET